MKAPLSYYAGKQRMIKYLLPLVPEHRIYTETFAGGAALFWAKEPSEIEVLNDINGELMTFYKVLKTDYLKLKKKIGATLHSREQHRQANIIYKHSKHFSDLDRAWAVWVLSRMSYAARFDGTFGYDLKKNSMSKKIKNSKEAFTNQIAHRLESTQLESTDALKIIKHRDCNETFHFADPPYPGTALGHFKGYTEADFKNLLDLLKTVKGKFLLTMYPDKLLGSYIKKYGWVRKKQERTISASKTERKKQVEWLVMNYKI